MGNYLGRVTLVSEPLLKSELLSKFLLYSLIKMIISDNECKNKIASPECNVIYGLHPDTVEALPLLKDSYSSGDLTAAAEALHWEPKSWTTNVGYISSHRKVGDAMNVDNSGDYKEMMKKINDKRSAVVKIFIDMKDVEKLPRGTVVQRNELRGRENVRHGLYGAHRVTKELKGLRQESLGKSICNVLQALDPAYNNLVSVDTFTYIMRLDIDMLDACVKGGAARKDDTALIVI
ncbi:hypothetical protein BDN67DRAFT_983607 [Paxillus ammoniavirescens]|nr:hypothetical protein BDN67DRAFT_983607 [Paxillus ammoniavirescens]